MTDPIVAFITTHLDRVEMASRDLVEHLLDGGPAGIDFYALPAPVRHHVLTWTPRQVRQAAAGLRRIVARHVPSHVPIFDEPPAHCMGCSRAVPCPDLLDVAGLFEGGDDWNPDWKVTT